MLAGLTVLTLRGFAIGTIVGCAPKALAWSGIGALLSYISLPGLSLVAPVTALGRLIAA
jgi:uncharacterized membrane protein YdjX (TVP38/TMEM64 family)